MDMVNLPVVITGKQYTPGDNVDCLIVHRIQHGLDHHEISTLMEESFAFHRIGTVNWNSFPSRPVVDFCICHDGKNIHLFFRVDDLSVRAIVTGINGPVYTDSCVELFLSPRSNGFYYNLEFNAIGTVLGGYGRGRGDRVPLPVDVLDHISVFPSLGRDSLPSTMKDICWELMVTIPSDVFIHDGIDDLGGLEGMGNLYKCGDLTPDPHYLSLWPVGTDKPDFHRYDFFHHIVFD